MFVKGSKKKLIYADAYLKGPSYGTAISIFSNTTNTRYFFSIMIIAPVNFSVHKNFAGTVS